MNINWMGYFDDHDGYGRFNSRMIQALRRAGVGVGYLTKYNRNMPAWMNEEMGIDFSNLTISCVPPIEAIDVPGRHWLITMLESNTIDHKHLMNLDSVKLERIFVPCHENKVTLERHGITKPISIFRGGTDPYEFPRIDYEKRPNRPYTFLVLTDRGMRKGWSETWEAFYKAFGGKTTGDQDVRLILKYLPTSALVDTMTAMSQAEGADKRIIYLNEKIEKMVDLYSGVDCVVLPSYFEGWGMPHREAAMCGLPVITTKYSGMDDGFTDEWALIVDHIEDQFGWWVYPKVEHLAERMRWCYENQSRASLKGYKARTWLMENQTWDHAAEALLYAIQEDQWKSRIRTMSPLETISMNTLQMSTQELSL